MQTVITGRRGLDIRRPSTDILTARTKGNFKETGIMDLLSTLSFGEPLILMGDKGTGKTVSIEQWAAKKRAPFLRYGCTGETSDRELLGGFVLKSLEETWFALGVLPTAIDVANEVGVCILVLEEINALNAEAQKAVNSIADYRREVALPNIGVVMRLDPVKTTPVDMKLAALENDDDHPFGHITVVLDDGDKTYGFSVPKALCKISADMVGSTLKAGTVVAEAAKLWVVGTMNPDYGGTYELNEDFRSRFQFVEVSHLKADDEMEVLLGVLGGRTSSQEKLFVRGLHALAEETRNGKLGYALSTRDLEQTLKSYIQFSAAGHKEPLSLALKMLEGKFPKRHLDDFRARVRSVFNNPAIDLTSVSLYDS